MLRNLFIVANFLLVVALGAYMLYDRHNSRQGYVINQRIFDEFKGKKELEIRLNEVRSMNKARLDSLESLIENEKTSAGLKGMYQDLLKRSQLQEQEISAKYTADIWKHINESTARYGRENGFDFIFGASGDGGLMYAEQSRDITDAVVKYINDEYENGANN